MNILEDWEINTYINYLPFADRNAWEMCRNQMYITAQVNSTKKIKPNEVLRFAWEEISKPIKTNTDNIPTDEEIKKARMDAMSFQAMVQNNEINNFEAVSLIKMLDKNKL